ncbi:MAG: hypothetical protein Q3996_00310 [Candidatus Saccharibacteria bacterium]|nr:hypothetical protein [Candidatus Saccharibacteria bacterium]
MERQKISKKQKVLLDYIDGFVIGQGFSPSYREIAEALGYKSIATVAEHVNNLVMMNYLRKVDGSARSLEIVKNTDHYQPLELKDQINIRLQQLDELELNTVRKAFRILNIDELQNLLN